MGGLRRARDVQRRRTAGSPTGREPYGDGVPIVVAGVTTCRGGRESRATGRRGTGDREVQRWEACGMQSAETELDIIRTHGTWMQATAPVRTGSLESRVPGNWPALFGKGPTEKARVTGTSPAAYFTLKAGGGR